MELRLLRGNGRGKNAFFPVGGFWEIGEFFFCFPICTRQAPYSLISSFRRLLLSLQYSYFCRLLCVLSKRRYVLFFFSSSHRSLYEDSNQILLVLRFFCTTANCYLATNPYLHASKPWETSLSQFASFTMHSRPIS